MVVGSSDGTPIAVFTSGIGPPLILVHGASADHTTFRVIGPVLARHFTVHAIDRRGRGASGDGPSYAIEHEFEDVAKVATVARKIAFGSQASVAVSYEGAPAPPGSSYHQTAIEARMRERLAAGDPDGALELFLAEVVGMPAADLAAYRADPIWPRRAMAAGTILRELEAEADPEASLERLGAVRQPVLQFLGGESLPVFREATVALDERLADGRIVVIEGARHAAHHTHPEEVVAAVRSFLA
jgi:pimeloyl-ACP methyl ester carboxylesterase